jgi:nicotinamide phosphoribosyltransferase
LDLYPEGILSVVSDTWNLWDVCTKFLPLLKEKILARSGKLVIRPDSGDPVDIICGTETFHTNDETSPEKFGVIELLWDTFGGKINDYGYKELDPHIGAIYGDSITLDRAKAICEGLKAKGFASTNVVFGIGSYTYQYNTRDTFGFAMKATYGEVEEDFYHDGEGYPPVKAAVGREIFKAPITDDGTKKSAKGLLQVYETSNGYKLKDQCTWDEERQGALSTIFINGQLIRQTTLEDVKKRLKV